MFVKASTFDLMDKRQQEKFNKIISLIREDTVSPKDIENFLVLVLNVIKDSKNELNKISSETLTDIADALDLIKKNHSDTISEIDKKATEVTSQFNNKLIEFNLFVKEVKKMRLKGDTGKDGKDGVNPNPEDVVPLVLEKIPKPIEETGETIADKLELLKGDKRLDASAIKNLPEATGGKGGSTARNLWQLQDVVLTEVADDQILKYDADLQAWVNGTGGSGAVDSVNGQTGVVVLDADDIDDTSTTHKFVTAADITKLGNLSGTNTGDQTSIVGITGTKAQFDTAVTDGNFLYVGDITQYTDELAQDAVGGMVANSTFVSLAYNDGVPSLTASLSATGTPDNTTYLRGDNTWATIAGGGDVSKVGTPSNNQMAVWTGDGTLEGTSDLIYDGTSLNLITGKNFQIAGATVLSDSAGTLTLSSIDALDATTEATIEGAIDTLANLVSVQGLTVTLADAGADALFGWDDSAGAYQNLSASDVRTALSLVIGTNVQAWDAQLDTWATVTPSANGQSLVSAADYAAMRALLDLEAGTDFYSIAGANAAFQPLDSDLTTIAGLTATTDNFIVSVASAWASRTPSQVRTTLGIGSAGLVATDLADLNEATIEGAIDTLANLTSIQGRTVTLSDAGFDVLAGWDDSASAYKNFLLADITTEASPATGDFLMLYGAEGDLRKVNWSSLPSGGSVSFGTDNQIPFTNAGGTDFDYSANLTFNGTALALAGNQTISQGTITTDVKALDISSTWNNGAVAFTGIKLNATQTASASTSLLMDLQRDSTSVFKVAKNGAVTIDPGSGFGSGSSNPVLTLRAMYGTSSFYGTASSALAVTGSFQVDGTLLLAGGISFQATGQTVDLNSGNITNLNQITNNGSLSFIKMYHDYNGAAAQASQGIIMRYANRSAGTYPRAAYQVYSSSDSTEIPFMVSSQGFAWLRNSKTDEVALTIKGATSQTANLQNWIDSSDAVLASVSAAGLGTFAGVALGSSSLTMTGSLAATGARVTKGWFTDIESTNMPTVGGTAILTSLTAPQFTTIELGHASANTLSASGGVLSIEGKALVNLTDGGTFAADISVPAEAYGAGWNGSNEVPTKNDVYDKIQTLSSPTCLTLIPKSPIPWDDGSDATAAATLATNTTASVGQIIIPFGITVNKLTIRTGGTVATPGTFDIVVYSEDGQTQLISVTTATIDTINTLYTTAVSAVSLPAGIYYILIVPNSTASATIHMWQSQPNPMFGTTAGIAEDVASEPVIQGTLTVTASTPPATFTPSSITGVAQNVTLACRLDN